MSELQQRHNSVMGGSAPMFYDQPVELASGDGVWLHATDGRTYLDAYNNVPCVGHANPRVTEAIARQVATLNVHSRYLHEGVISYAERLTALHADHLTAMVFTCTGSEANEVAMTMARTMTRHQVIIGTDGTYHGNTPEVAKLNRLPAHGSRSGVASIPTPDRFRPLSDGLSDAEHCELLLVRLAATIERLQRDEGGVAGLMLCSILANEGLTEPPATFLDRAIAMVRDAGGLIIADEVQAGFARSGSMWGYETMGFVPDIVTMGKPMGNGMPVAAVVADFDTVTNFRRNRRYFNTFAGTPLQAAAADAVLDEIEGRGLVAQVAEVGASVREQLEALAADRPEMGDVRGHGLFLGIDWVKPGTTEPDVEGAKLIVEGMKERGVLLGQAGMHGNVVKVRPPLVFEHEHATQLIDALAETLDAN